MRKIPDYRSAYVGNFQMTPAPTVAPVATPVAPTVAAPVAPSTEVGSLVCVEGSGTMDVYSNKKN